MSAKGEHKGTGQNNQNRTETGQPAVAHPPMKKKTKLPKTHQDYWSRRLRKRTYMDSDGVTEIPTWQIRLHHLGREGWFNLDTANQAAAAAKARDIYVFLIANGWEATVAKFKPASETAKRTNLTVGDFLKAVKNLACLRIGTFLNYQNCFRTIISEAFGLKGGMARYDYRQGGNQKWVERIDSIRMERLTPARVTAWQQKRVKQAGHSPATIGSAKRTINTYVRCARSLFSREIRKRLKTLHFPAVLPFDEVEFLDGGSTKYISKVDAKALILAARNELKGKDPEAYKAFLLGLFAGMRKKEIDLLEWDMLDFANNVINLEDTNWLQLKTSDSKGQITLDPEPMAELKSFMPSSKSSFVINSIITIKRGDKIRTRTRPPRNDSARPYYRCAPVFKRLNEWLRSKGIKANKPLHELRKEIGAMIATQEGIYAASQFLRHSDITTTARHYAQHKTRISVGLGKILSGQLPAIVPSEKAA